MTPEDLELVASDAELVIADSEAFALGFYAVLFEIAPGTRGLFAADMASQRAKLVDEIVALVAMATARAEPGSFDDFVSRTRALGRRHVQYGVTADMYEPVRVALLGALHDHVPGFDEDHRRAWDKLDRLVGEIMLEGAAESRPGGGPG